MSENTKVNLYLVGFFTVMGIISFLTVNHEEKPIVIRATKSVDSTDMFGPVLPGEKDEFDFSQDDGVSDSLVYGEWEPDYFLSDSVYFNNLSYIDSIKTIKDNED